MGKKKFDKDLFDAYDEVGKIAATRYFRWLYPLVKITENPFGVFGIDLKVETGKDTFFVDVEVRPEWVEDKFPFETIHLPARKVKFLSVDGNVAFLSLNKALTKGLFFTLKDQDPCISIANKYVTTGEDFYNIPVSRCVDIEII